MKKITLLLLIIATASYGNCCAQNVIYNEAVSVALQALDSHLSLSSRDVVRVNTNHDSIGNILMYEVITSDSNIVLVSGSKACVPIIGIYHGVRGIFESEEIPCGLAVMVDYYKQSIEYCLANNIRNGNIEKWRRILSGERQVSQRSGVGPLLSTKWGQNKSNDNQEENAYNCEMSGNPSCAHYPAGCVAVAMGQVMSYYKYPSITYDVAHFSEQFDWCHMPDALWVSSPRFEHECHTISELLKICGEAAQTYYSCNEAGTTNNYALVALRDCFHYSSSIKLITRPHTIPWWNLNSFLDTVEMSLNMYCPVIMGARDRETQKLHTFVCDGYRDDMYSFNWGANGDFNGFYSFDFWGNITVSNHVFSRDFEAVVFIRPSDSPENICNTEMHLDDFYTDFYSQSVHNTTNDPPSNNAPRTMSTLYSAHISSPEQYRTIPVSAHDAVYTAYKEIYLQDGFIAKYGCDFTARIDPCSQCETRESQEQGQQDFASSNHNYSNHVNNLMAGTLLEDALHDAIYPNPTEGKIIVAIDGDVKSIVIHTTDGHPMGGWKLLTLGDNRASLDVSSLADGAYILTVRCTNGTATITKFIKQKR